MTYEESKALEAARYEIERLKKANRHAAEIISVQRLELREAYRIVGMSRITAARYVRELIHPRKPGFIRIERPVRIPKGNR